MRPNVGRGTGFRGVLQYAWDRRKQGARVGGNVEGMDPRSVAREFGHARALRPDCRTPVWHCSLSCPAREHLTPEQWDQAARTLLTEVGMDPDLHQYVVIQHGDTAHEHVHVVASRIGLDGSLAYCQRDAEAAQRATDRIEAELGLTRTRQRQDPTWTPDPTVRCTRREIEMWRARGVDVPPKYIIAASLDAAMAAGASSWSELAEAVALDGIELTRNARGTGYRLTWTEPVTGEECSYKASDIGKAWGYAAVAAKLEEVRDGYEAGAGEDSGLTTAGGPGHQPVQAGADAGRDPEPSPEPGHDAPAPEPEAKRDPGRDSGDDPQEPGAPEPGPEPGRRAERELGQEPGARPGPDPEHGEEGRPGGHPDRERDPSRDPHQSRDHDLGTGGHRPGVGGGDSNGGDRLDDGEGVLIEEQPEAHQEPQEAPRIEQEAQGAEPLAEEPETQEEAGQAIEAPEIHGEPAGPRPEMLAREPEDLHEQTEHEPEDTGQDLARAIEEDYRRHLEAEQEALDELAEAAGIRAKEAEQEVQRLREEEERKKAMAEEEEQRRKAREAEAEAAGEAIEAAGERLAAERDTVELKGMKGLDQTGQARVYELLGQGVPETRGACAEEHAAARDYIRGYRRAWKELSRKGEPVEIGKLEGRAVRHCLERGHTVEDTAAALMEHSPQTVNSARADVERAVEGLAGRAGITTSTPGPSPAPGRR